MKLSAARLRSIRALDPYRARQLESGNFSRVGPYIKTDSYHHAWYLRDYRDLQALIDTPTELINSKAWRETDATTRTGTRNADWKKRLYKQDYVGSEYSLDRVSYERDLQLFAATKPKQYWDTYGRVLWGTDKWWRDGYNEVAVSEPPALDASVLNSLDQKALLHLAQKTKETYQKISGGVFLGEIRETLRMIRSPAMALRKATSAYFSALKRRADRARSVKDLRRAVNSTYLEFTFGAQPLVSDVKAGARAFAEVLNRRENDGFRPIRSKRFGFSKKTMISHDPAWQIPWMFPVSHIYADRKILTSQEYIVSYWTMQDFRLARWKRPEGWWTTFGLTPAEFIPTIWELIPWSFVVDYFTNIGDILNFESTDWSKVVDCFKQVRTTSSYEVWDKPDGPKTIAAWALSGWTDNGVSKAVKKRETFQRTRVDIRNQHLDFEFQIIPARARQNFNLSALGLQMMSASTKVRQRHAYLNARDGHKLGGQDVSD